MKILFWNTYRNININKYIVYLVDRYEVDVVLLAEYNGKIDELDDLLFNSNQQLIRYNTVGCNRIKFWCNYHDVNQGSQNVYHTLQVLNQKIIICGIHLFSDLHGNKSDERLEVIKEIKYDINKLKQITDINKVIIIGDFNEMPYDKGCLNANGFHGLSVLNYTDKNTRKVNGRQYEKYYNPMWNLFGNFDYPPGTYYSFQSSLRSPMWYMFDQVLLSQEVIPFFKKESLKIITSGLKTENGHPNKKISDHFPILVEIEESILNG